MAWTAPRTYVAGEIITASIGNVHWRDNFTYLKTQQDLDDTHRADASDPHGATLTQSTAIFIGDTANAKMTQGLTINQGAADDEIQALKSSDVDHGMTSLAESDTFANISKTVAASGGVSISGYTSGTFGVVLVGYGVTDNTDKNSSAAAYTAIQCGKKNGTTYTTPGANANLCGIGYAGAGGIKFLFDVEGDSHEDGTGWTAYDEHDDTQLLDLVNTALTRRDPVKAEFWDWVRENAQKLQDLKLITFNVDGHHFINRSKMQELLVGAVRQQGRDVAALRERLERAEQALVAAGVNPKSLEA